MFLVTMLPYVSREVFNREKPLRNPGVGSKWQSTHKYILRPPSSKNYSFLPLCIEVRLIWHCYLYFLVSESERHIPIVLFYQRCCDRAGYLDQTAIMAHIADFMVDADLPNSVGLNNYIAREVSPAPSHEAVSLHITSCY